MSPSEAFWPTVAALSLCLNVLLTWALFALRGRPAASAIEPGEPPLDRHIHATARRPMGGP